MAPVINLYVKFAANIFIGDRYMAILLLHRFGCEVPIPAHFGEVFWGFDPLIGYCRDPQKAHPWPETRVTAYKIVPIGQEMRPGRVMKKAKKERKKRNSKI